MSTLFFKALNIRLHDEYGRPSTEGHGIFSKEGEERKSESPERNTSLSFRVKPDEKTRVKLSTGETFADMDGYITLKPGDEERPIASADKSRNHIGVMIYFGAIHDFPGVCKSSYHIDVLLPRSQFSDIVASVRENRIPPVINVDVEGLTLPDDFSNEWNINTSEFMPFLSIISINLSIPFASYERADIEDFGQQANHMPPMRHDFLRLLEAMSMVMGYLKNINRKLIWLIWLVLAMAILFILTR